MPFQGTVENTEIFNEVFWNEIDTEQSYFGFAEVILAHFALEFRRTWRKYKLKSGFMSISDSLVWSIE